MDVSPMPKAPVIPDHTLRRPIGRGAYGEVWLARNIMGAPRAVKIIWRRQFESDRPYEREFKGVQRYEPVSRSADGLVHVLHVGRNDAEGYFYYVMELADPVDPAMDTTAAFENPTSSPEVTPLSAYEPRTLRSDLKRLGRLPTADYLRLAIDVASGLAQLHRQGLVHRDVKPGNIIYVHGRAKLADLGLVTSGTEGRTFVGTEGYIPPEGPGSPSADLYALGIALYEASTGFSPDRFPDVPGEWLTGPGHEDAIEFHEIVLKACEGQPGRRYANAEAMQADLALLQSGQSIRRVRAVERRAEFVRRFGWAVAAVLTLAIGAALIFNWRAEMESASRAKEFALRQQAESAHEQAQRSLVRAEAAEREARQQLNTALFEQARALVASREVGHRTRALDALRRVAGTINDVERRRVAFAALSQPDFLLVSELRVPSIRFLMVPNPTLTQAAICNGHQPVVIRSLANGETSMVLPGNTNFSTYFAAWSPDGRHLAVKRNKGSAGREGLVEVWDVATSPRLLLDRLPVAYESFSFHPKQPWLMTGRIGGGVTVFDLTTTQSVRNFRLPGTVHALAWSPDGGRMAASYKLDTNWVVAIHHSATLERLVTLECPEPAEFIAWHPGGQWISMTGAGDSEWHRQVRLLDASSGQLTILGRHKLKAARLVFTGDGRHLISAGWDRDLMCWDLRTMQRSFTFPDIGYHQGWNREGTRCAAVSREDTVQFYQFQSPLARELLTGLADGFLGGEYSPDGRWLAASGVRLVCVWDLHNDGPPASFPKPNAHRILFTPDSREIVLSGDETLDRWQLLPAAQAGAPPQLLPRPMPPAKNARRASVSGGELVLTMTDGVRFVALTNLDSGNWDRFVPARDGWGQTSPDGQWLAYRYHYSKSVRVYELPELKPIKQVIASNYVYSATFSPDRQEMIVVHRDGADWWDTATWERKREYTGAPIPGSYVFYTPDGSGLWTVIHFRQVGLHDRRTLEPLLLLPAETAPVAASPDGQSVAVSIDRRRIQIWKLPELRLEFRRLGLDWETGRR